MLRKAYCIICSRFGQLLSVLPVSYAMLYLVLCVDAFWSLCFLSPWHPCNAQPCPNVALCHDGDLQCELWLHGNQLPAVSTSVSRGPLCFQNARILVHAHYDPCYKESNNDASMESPGCSPVSCVDVVSLLTSGPELSWGLLSLMP